MIPGFSAVVEGDNGRFYAQPDNGFGTKANSADFLLRIYVVKPQWETADGGPGRIEIKSFISLRDPDHKIDFPIVNDATPDRLLTGADFDVESLVRSPDGTFWIGDEFGPFLLHVSATGKLLQAPVPFPDGMSPQNPYLQPGQATRIGASRGFEAMGGSADGKHLYPILEGAFTDDADQRRRWIYEFDTTTGAVHRQALGLPDRRGHQLRRRRLHREEGQAARRRARQLRRPGRRVQADLRGRPRPHRRRRASSRSRSSSTCSRSPTPTASA